MENNVINCNVSFARFFTNHSLNNDSKRTNSGWNDNVPFIPEVAHTTIVAVKDLTSSIWYPVGTKQFKLSLNQAQF